MWLYNVAKKSSGNVYANVYAIQCKNTAEAKTTYSLEQQRSLHH